MESPWILNAVCLLLALSVTWDLAQGTNTTATSPGTHAIPLFPDNRSEMYSVGGSVNLTCTNKTWSQMLYTTWKLNVNGIPCTIAASTEKSPHDDCLDGKVLRNTTKGESYLHIPLFKATDEGMYECQTVSQGSNYIANINVSAAVSPEISIRLDLRDGKREAVCSAAGGKPAASISWRNTWNSSVTLSSRQNSDGSFTLESRFILPEPVSADNLSCIVSHPSWRGGRIIKGVNSAPAPGEPKWIWIIILLGSVSFIAAILTGLFITRKHLGKLRNCCKSAKISAPPPPKAPQTQDVEEVEPYASYVQRVNSIYNSSAELCNA